MPLFTDTAVITLDDLQQFEASIVQTAAVHGINVQTKIALATSAVGDKVLLWLMNAGAADPFYASRRSVGLSTVVLTPSLARWLCFESLARFFGEAYNVQLNTRYQGKWNEYKAQALEAADLFFNSGVGCVKTALPRPELPFVAVQSGISPAQSVFAQVTWVDSTGNESAASEANGQILQANSTVVVGMQEGATNAAPAAVGWNVYCGNSADSITLQNAQPVAIGSTWQMPLSGLILGRNAGDGQVPNYFVNLSRRLNRG